MMFAALLLGALLSGTELDLMRDCTVTNDSLVIDSLAVPGSVGWRCYAQDAGERLFQCGERYEITFRARIAAEAGTAGRLLVLVRPETAAHGRLDAGSLRADPTAGVWRDFSLRIDGLTRDDYRLQFHSWGRIRAEIADLKVRRRAPYAFIPAPAGETQRTDAPITVPTGAADFEVALPQPDACHLLEAADYGVSETNADNTAMLRAALEAVRQKGAAGLRFARGTYRFTSDAPVALAGLEDFTFDGGGATFVTRRRAGVFMSVAGCTRIRLRNFTLDWDWAADPLASLVRVAEVRTNSYDLTFVDYDDFPRKDTELMVLSAWDPATRSVGFEGGLTRTVDFGRRDGGRTRRTWLSGNTLRVFRAPDGLLPGQLYRLQHYYYHMGGLALQGNVDLRLEDITVLSTPGHAFSIGGTQHHTLFDRVKIVVPEDDPRRIITCTADHLHVVNSQGYLKLENCDFSRGADDCINLHDCSGFARRAGVRTIRTENARHYGDLPAGTRIELRRADYSPAAFTGTVTGIVPVDPARAVYDISFAEEVPDDRGEGFVMFNRTYDTHNIIIRRCSFHDNRARGLLILARDVTVEDCVFRHHEMGAIKIETGYTLNVWSEGYGVSNVVVRNCLFDNVNPSGSNRLHGERSIYMGIYLRNDPSSDVTDYPILRDILFENNVFRTDSGVVAWISSAQDVLFRKNVIDESIPRRTMHADRGRFLVQQSRNVRFLDNTWRPSASAPAPGISWDPETCRGIEGAGNSTATAVRPSHP